MTIKNQVSKIQAARRETLDLVDRLTEPEQMTKQEALETLEELSVDIEGRIEALKEEMKNEELR